MEITTEQNLQMKNVLSYRGKVDQKLLMEKRKEIDDVMNRFGARPIHPAITSTFGIEKTENGPIMDLEILVPLDKDISHEIAMAKLPGYRFKPLFLLANAVRIRHEGSTETMENSIRELYKFIQVRNLKPITTGYSIPMNDPDDPKDLIIDFMVGVDPNIL
ncbi:MAG: AraC family transcriptional regulator [Lachnospiraceae bacterium]|nr:AraC family transcriptional regulator [Lachnospiraceae bacterium]